MPTTAIVGSGFTAGIVLAKRLDEWGALFAPHHYGTCFGSYASCHLAAAGQSFCFVEWDEAAVAGLSAPGYQICEDKVSVPGMPGFGLERDEATFAQAVDSNGFRFTLAPSPDE